MHSLMDKQTLRDHYKLKRAELSDVERENLSLGIANKSLEMNIWDKRIFHIFLPIVRLREINTEYLLNILQGKDKEIVIPKSIPSTRSLTNYLLTDSTKIAQNLWGIPEPLDGIRIDENLIDVVFVPLLGVDKKGNRLGYGKGFYDRFLSRCRKDCLKIGLSFFEPFGDIPVDETDIPLNYCITAYKIYTFNH